MPVCHHNNEATTYQQICDQVKQTKRQNQIQCRLKLRLQFYCKIIKRNVLHLHINTFIGTSTTTSYSNWLVLLILQQLQFGDIFIFFFGLLVSSNFVKLLSF